MQCIRYTSKIDPSSKELELKFTNKKKKKKKKNSPTYPTVTENDVKIVT